MGIKYVGNTEFEDIKEPARSKNEWGVDVLTRLISGRKPRLAAFLASLHQGAVFGGHYLQSWQDDGGNVFPQVELIYKGLNGGILPPPDGQNDTTTKTITKSGKITSEDVAEQIKGEPLTAEETRDVYLIKEVIFRCPCTRWRYVVNVRPAGARYNTINSSEVPKVLRSRISAKWKNQETIFSGNAPAAIVSALFTPPLIKVESHQASNIIGTPFWEAMDVVAFELEGD